MTESAAPDDRATTALCAAELTQLVAAARADVGPAAVDAAPRATEGIPQIVMIVDRPRSVIDGLVKSAGRTATRLVTLTRFRAIGAGERPGAPRVAAAALPDAALVPPQAAVAGELAGLELELELSGPKPPRAMAAGTQKVKRPRLGAAGAGGVVVTRKPFVDRYLVLAIALAAVSVAWLAMQAR
jgi:hypothetical protein